MNATWLAALGSTMILVVSGSEPTLQEIRRFSPLDEKVLVYSNGFDDSSREGMSLDRCAQLVPGEGLHQSGALRIRGDATEKGRSARLDLPEGIADARYIVSVSVRAEGMKYHGTHKAWYGYIATHQRDAKTGKSILSKYSVTPFAAPPGEEYEETRYSFVGQEGKKPYLALSLRDGWSGTIWFDDVRVWRSGIATTTLFTYPRQNTFFGDEGKFTLHADVPARIRAAAVVSLEKDGKILKELVVRADGRGNLCGDFGPGMPLGPATVRVLLADLNQKRSLGESAFPVTVRAKEPVARNAAVLDEHDRLFVDGKPFMPLGLYFSSPDEDREAAYRRISEAGFNCILDYGVLRASKQDPDLLKAVAARLDLAQKHGLKQIFNIAGLHREASGEALKKDLGESDREKAMDKLINAFKGHPALIGWYIADELSMSEIPEVTRAKDRVNAIDPWHPVITLTNKPLDLPQYALSGNVFMPDAYPLRTDAPQDVDEYLRLGMLFGKRSGLPVWAVPQAFNWGVVSAETAEQYRRYSLPTEEDMRSMALHFAIDGATGFVFYNYPDSFSLKRAAKFGDPDYFERVWPRIQGLAQSVRGLEPFVTSMKQGPAVAVENRGKATVRAMAYTAENGKHCLIVVGCGGAGAEAVITVPGLANLKSRFGRTENLGTGRYQFTSPGLGSDMLFD